MVCRGGGVHAGRGRTAINGSKKAKMGGEWGRQGQRVGWVIQGSRGIGEQSNVMCKGRKGCW